LRQCAGAGHQVAYTGFLTNEQVARYGRFAGGAVSVGSSYWIAPDWELLADRCGDHHRLG